jgi:guanylate kinase
MSKYKVIAICGKSASGKDTFLQYIKNFKGTHEIISCTTRPKREGEVEGVNYHFRSPGEFLRLEWEGQMLETSNFREWHYGTPLWSLKKSAINIGVFNPEGIRSLMEDPRVQLYVVQVIASDKTRLLRSLNREEAPDVDEIVRRYMTDKKDFENFSAVYEPDFIVENEGQGINPQQAYALSERILDEAKRHWAKEAN